jgi:hypothetical protein
VKTILRSGGISYDKKTIVQVKKAIREKGSWTGLLVPNKVNSFHFEGGWHLGHRETFTSIEELTQHVDNCLYYMERELGTRVAFYECSK